MCEKSKSYGCPSPKLPVHSVRCIPCKGQKKRNQEVIHKNPAILAFERGRVQQQNSFYNVYQKIFLFSAANRNHCVLSESEKQY